MIVLVGLLSVVSFAYTIWFSIWMTRFVERVMLVVQSGQLEELALIESMPGSILAHSLASVVILVLVVVFFRDVARRFPEQFGVRLAWFAALFVFGPFVFPLYFFLHYRHELEHARDVDRRNESPH